jgi:hypothetical protein
MAAEPTAAAGADQLLEARCHHTLRLANPIFRSSRMSTDIAARVRFSTMN